MIAFTRTHLFVGVASLLVAFAAQPVSAQNTRTVDLELEVGQQTTISAHGVRSYSEGVSGIADVRLTDDQTRFVIVGTHDGVTSLLLIMNDGSQRQYRITVGGGEPEPEAEGGVQERENIRLDLYFVQLKDTYSHSIGIGWPGSIGGDGNTATLNFRQEPNTTTGMTESQTTFSVVANQALPRLDISQSSGWARLFRQAAVVTANGERAEFSDGGELNVIIRTGFTASLEQIPYGTKLKILPRYDPETHRIEITIQADISHLADDNGTGVPSRVRSEVRSVVNLELGQSIVLAGAIARTDTRSRSGLPGLSQIPVVGALFGIHARQEEQNEALLFIVPSVVDAVPLVRRNRIQEALRVYEDYRGSIEDVELLEQPRIRRSSGSAPETPPRAGGAGSN